MSGTRVTFTAGAFSNKTEDGRYVTWPKRCPKCGSGMWGWKCSTYYQPAALSWESTYTQKVTVSERVIITCRDCHAEIPCLPVDAGGVR